MSGSGLDDKTPPAVASFALTTFHDSRDPNSVSGSAGTPTITVSNAPLGTIKTPTQGANLLLNSPDNPLGVTKKHRRSVSHVGVSPLPPATGDTITSHDGAAAGVSFRGHSRSQSQGQVARGHRREGSRAEFILPEGHEQRERERELRPAKSFAKKSSLPRRGHAREASRTESVYTIRDHKRTLLQKLCFWKDKKNESCARLVVPNNDCGVDLPRSSYQTNHIRTTKYSPLSFIPKNLFEQFHRFANLYFLFIVLLNFVPMVTVFMKELTMAPLLFVLSMTAIKDACEDWRRFSNDRRVNASKCKVFCRSTGKYEDGTWKDIRVGDLLQLKADEVIPADMVVLNSSDEHGICYIESSNLDGETNLKQRQAVRGIAKDGIFDPGKLDCVMEVGPPTTKMYHFVGSIPFNTGENITLTKENLILRDCVIKNTDFVEGIVVYAGCDTKALLNHGGTRYKRSKLERQMNRHVVWCVGLLFVICIASATGAGVWQSSTLADISSSMSPLIPFLHMESTSSSSSSNPFWVAFTSFWSFLLLYQVLIPISLYVTIEVVKLIQIYHINKDPDFEHKESGTSIECRALNINEELGQVQHIFTDKTGTLTENKMVFQKCTFNGKDFTHEPILDSKDPQETFIVNPDLEKEILTLSDSASRSSVEGQRMSDFFFTLSACNTVIVAKQQFQIPNSHCAIDDSLNSTSDLPSLNTSLVREPAPSPWLWGRRGKLDLSLSSVEEISSISSASSKVTNGRTPDEQPKPTFEAESPDELALVNAAFNYGFRLLRRNLHAVAVNIPGVGTKEFEILHILPFDSNRKRMSIIIKHPDTGHKIIFCKGADSAIFDNLAPSSGCSEERFVTATKELLHEYSKKGLRVLCMAKRVLTTEEYLQWSLNHKKVESSLANHEEKLSQSYNTIECNLQLLGATGIEDRLQDGVPETIRSLREAGIVIWVLTGDKQETAINIAYACSLFTPNTELMTVSARTRDQAERIMSDYHRNLLFREANSSDSWRRNTSRGLVIDGRTLVFVLDRRAKLSELFLALTDHCSSVMCCRATPLQKALVVRLIKGKDKVLTLAVGDGANDVSMIKTADVGVGISGVEGRQAVMSSDFAIARFRHLEKLILVHGRWCYDRLARVVLFFFYKNACFVFLTMWFQLYNGFSAASMMDELNLIMFNLIYTSLPPITIGIYDRDCPEEILLARPQLYGKSRLGIVYTPATFRLGILDALYQSFVIFFISAFSFKGSDAGMFEFGFSVCHICLVTQLLHVSLETKSWTVVHLCAIVMSYLGFFLVSGLHSAIWVTSQPLPSQFGELVNMISNPAHWFALCVSCVLALIPRLTFRVIRVSFWPDEVTTALLQKREISRGRLFEAGSVDSSSHSSINRQRSLPC